MSAMELQGGGKEERQKAEEGRGGYGEWVSRSGGRGIQPAIQTNL
jgi:hypothetical protein